MGRIVPVRPTNPEHEAELAASLQDASKTPRSALWGTVKHVGGGRIRIDCGVHRIEGCRSGAYNVLFHNDKELAIGLKFPAAVKAAEDMENARLAEQKRKAEEIAAAKAAKEGK